jgi:2-polyprenyl-3-methyl-5-hydroxy-6-metoxy-1,4-benzoquinol methylase
MTTTRTVDEVRSTMRGMWTSVVPAWVEYEAYVEHRSAALSRRILELVDPRPGDRVLEMACGLGGLGLSAARLVSPGGSVVLSDLVPGMTEAAVASARREGIDNVMARPLDLEHIDEADAVYDVVLCREGLMFVPDPAAAVAELQRVLAPGGRMCVSVWGPREENPWLGLVFDAVRAATGRPVPPPGVPGPFSLAEPGLLQRLVAREFQDVTAEEFLVPVRAASFEQWWTRTAALAGPLSKILETLPEATKAAISDRLRDAVTPYRTGDGIELPGLALVVSGRV